MDFAPMLLPTNPILNYAAPRGVVELIFDYEEDIFMPDYNIACSKLKFMQVLPMEDDLLLSILEWDISGGVRKLCLVSVLQ